MDKNSLKKTLGNRYTVMPKRFFSNKRTCHYSGILNLTSETVRNLNQFKPVQTRLLVWFEQEICTVSQNERTFSPIRRILKSSGSLFEAFGRNLKTPPPAAVPGPLPCFGTQGQHVRVRRVCSVSTDYRAREQGFT